MINKYKFRLATLILLIVPCLVFFSGCVPLTSSGSSDTGMANQSNSSEGSVIENEPYYPTEHNDILIPAELVWIRDQSVSINTPTFNGGVLNFSGRVEVNSLTEFFINSMNKNHWQITGSVKSNNVFLTFIKPNATCMIRILESSITGKTDVFISVAKNLQP
ncbi:MAG: hypothetical protein KKB30_13955 [Proteobacteria bacterium]|nr:hypothetical protein [Pseudomonadota bacterium]MBU1715954.1 hypothetical protein [Pseudomonadota bacterium]